tara:strand:+ start:288 stop:527 length:240 start_codon:yes stop_codon:yes gene_type:complete
MTAILSLLAASIAANVYLSLALGRLQERSERALQSTDEALAALGATKRESLVLATQLSGVRARLEAAQRSALAESWGAE